MKSSIITLIRFILFIRFFYCGVSLTSSFRFLSLITSNFFFDNINIIFVAFDNASMSSNSSSSNNNSSGGGSRSSSSRDTYQLIYSPLHSGEFKGRISFSNPTMGQFWYILNLTATAAEAVILDEIECMIGSSATISVPIENPFGTLQ